MKEVCPITDARINERVTRLNAFFTVVLSLLFIFLNFWVGLVFLVIDFVIRGFIDGKYSLICILNKWIVKNLNLSSKMMNAGPKIFAAQIGFVLSFVSLVAFSFGCNIFCMALMGMLAVFSFLEMAFGFCVACQIYPLIRRNRE